MQMHYRLPVQVLSYHTSSDSYKGLKGAPPGTCYDRSTQGLKNEKENAPQQEAFRFVCMCKWKGELHSHRLRKKTETQIWCLFTMWHIQIVHEKP